MPDYSTPKISARINAWRRSATRTHSGLRGRTLSLRRCNISPADLSRLASEPSLPSLRRLNLSLNSLGPDGAADLAPELAKFSQLASLNLSHNSFGPNGAALLFPELANLSQLASLNLWNNSLGPKGISALARQLAKLSQLAELNLGNNALGPEGAAAIAHQLPKLSQLVSLNLWNNALGHAGAAVLAPQLAKLSRLTSLNLSDNALHSKGANSLAPQLAKLSQLASLNLSYNTLGPKGAAALELQLARLPQLTYLNLSDNALGHEGAALLAPQLARLSQLTSLNLSYNGLRSKGAAALAPHLAKLSKLARLDLSDNLLGPDGAAALEPELAKLSQLASLNLSYNALGPKGAASIAAQLAKLSQLASLNLYNNAFGPKGASSLASELAKLHKLASLNLSYNSLGPNGAAALAPQLAKLSELASLDLRANDLDVSAILKFLEACLPASVTGRHTGGALRTMDVSGNRLPEEAATITDAAELWRWLTASTQPVLRIKSVILGDGMAGKTELVRKLQDAAAPCLDGQRTRAFRMVDLPWNVGKQTVTCRLIDFGGQKYLWQSHVGFISSQRCLYVCVIDTSAPDPEARLIYWLKYIRYAARPERFDEPQEGESPLKPVQDTPPDHGRRRTALSPVDTLWNDDTPREKLPPILIVCTKRDLKQSTPVNFQSPAILEQIQRFDRIEFVSHYSNNEKWKQFDTGYQQVRQKFTDLIAKMRPVFESKYPPAVTALLDWASRTGTTAPPDAPPLERFIDREHFLNQVVSPALSASQTNLDAATYLPQWLALLRNTGLVHYIGDSPQVAAHAPAGAKLIYHPEWVQGPLYALINSGRHSKAENLTGDDRLFSRQELENLLADERDNPIEGTEDLPWTRARWNNDTADTIIDLAAASEVLFEHEHQFLIPDRFEGTSKSLLRRSPDLAYAANFNIFLPESFLLRLAGRLHQRADVQIDALTRDLFTLIPKDPDDLEVLTVWTKGGQTIYFESDGANRPTELERIVHQEIRNLARRLDLPAPGNPSLPDPPGKKQPPSAVTVPSPQPVSVTPQIPTKAPPFATATKPPPQPDASLPKSTRAAEALGWRKITDLYRHYNQTENNGVQTGHAAATVNHAKNFIDREANLFVEGITDRIRYVSSNDTRFVTEEDWNKLVTAFSRFMKRNYRRKTRDSDDYTDNDSD